MVQGEFIFGSNVASCPVINKPMLVQIKDMPPFNAITIFPVAIGKGMTKPIKFLSPISEGSPCHFHHPRKSITPMATIDVQQFHRVNDIIDPQRRFLGDHICSYSEVLNGSPYRNSFFLIRFCLKNPDRTFTEILQSGSI